ncbi:nephrocystin-4-like [Engraulis encrasicolus]|uniref:nephrocystin-4-like n=1 Tax=Engraulis encrasicolus TaxID=184585 RepID=UPI002FD0D17E
MSDWTEEFGRSRTVPPRGQTARQSDSGRTPQGFKLALKKLDGVSVFQRALSVQLRGTLWDSLQHLFYGNTWRSREQQYSGEENTLDIQQEAVYFLSVSSASSVLVVELVELTSQHALGRGFGILQLDSASPGDQRVAMCKGTPRDLLTPGLKHTEVTGVELVCCLQHDASLRSVIPLLPPNMLISSHTHLPGTTHTPHTPHSADTVP